MLCLSFYSALVHGYLYIILTTITPVFESNYGFWENTSGLVYLGIDQLTNNSLKSSFKTDRLLGIGMIICIIICGITSDWYVKRKGVSAKPEHRLPPMVFGGIVIPIGLFLNGWTVEYQFQWMAPLIGTGLIGFGLMVTLVPTESYLVDDFTLHAASAVAVSTLLRNILGAVLPLVGPPMYDSFGLGWSNSLLGFIALTFVPMPILLMEYGLWMRWRFHIKPGIASFSLGL